MESTNALLLAGSLLLFTSVMLSRVTSRLGVPLLAMFLAVGMLAGVDGPGGIRFRDYDLAFLVGNLALAVILLDGGLRTRAHVFRVAMAPAITLATLGVVITAAALGLFAAWLLDVDWRYGLLLAAIVGSTDAAAVFSVLRQGGVRLNERVAATLEVESGVNDPMAIFLVILLVEWMTSERAPGVAGMLLAFVQQFGIGAVLGVAGGFVLARLLARLGLADGLHALLVLSGGLLLFAIVNAIGGSGFLAVYLAGLVVGNRPSRSTADVLRVMDGLAWLAQAGMFLVLGLLVKPSGLLDNLWEAVAIALFLMFVARPLAVALSLAPFRVPRREIAFIAWMGLRGAVPIVLSLFPLMAGMQQSWLLFEVAFAVVLGSLIVQGASVRSVARYLRVQLPIRERELQRTVLPVNMEPAPEVVTVGVDPDAPCAGRAVARLAREVSPSGLSSLSAIVREGRLVFPSADERLCLGDVVIVLLQREDEARLLRAFTPVKAAEKRSTQQFFGEFALDASASVGDVAMAYGVSVEGVDKQMSLAALLVQRLGTRVVVGDRLKLDRVTLTVREIEDGKVVKVGLKLTPA